MKTFDEWLTLVNSRVSEKFEGYDGNIINNLFKINYAIARGLQYLDEVRHVHEVVNNDVYLVEGNAQDELYSQDFVYRKAESPATGYWTTNDSVPNTIVPINALKLEAENEMTFTNLEQVVIDGNGAGTFYIQAEQVGSAGNLRAGELTRIKTPLVGINTGINNTDFHGGAERENDADYRERYLKTRLTYPGLTKSDIQAKVYEVAGFKKMYLQENETESTIYLNNGLAMPPKSFVAYVLGGSDFDVAWNLSLKVNTSIRMLGDVIMYVYKSVLQRNEEIRFFRAVEKKVYYKVYVDGTIDNGLLDALIVEKLLSFEIGERITSYKIARYVNEFINDSKVDSIDLEFSADNINFSSSYQLLVGEYVADTERVL